MKKRVMIIVDDYWHHKETIDPLIPLLFDKKEWDVTYTKYPNDLLTYSQPLDLFISFKDPIENDQIPTPIWCNEEWARVLQNHIENGMGFLAIHCGVTDIPENHQMAKYIIRSYFINHPKKCPVTFVPEIKHPILEGVEEFTFPLNDEHYMMKFYENSPTTILASTVSIHGKQPGLWVHQLGNGKICCITPGHYTENITYPPYLTLLKNAIKWCTQN